MYLHDQPDHDSTDSRPSLQVERAARNSICPLSLEGLAPTQLRGVYLLHLPLLYNIASLDTGICAHCIY